MARQSWSIATSKITPNATFEQPRLIKEETRYAPRIFNIFSSRLYPKLNGLLGTLRTTMHFFNQPQLDSFVLPRTAQKQNTISNESYNKQFSALPCTHNE